LPKFAQTIQSVRECLTLVIFVGFCESLFDPVRDRVTSVSDSFQHLCVVEFHYPKVIKSLPIRRPRGVWGGPMVPWGRGETKVRFVWKIC
jgi:hypothetical protein